ncbi:unnamed protein product [Effrenium voratum]|uniref:DUF1254 domain-containing protein n=1 Tax=Effrenium voratum TaxID=2562239 RepID=A0AA36HSS0_9DINO|nr:unnamed protein product [Effrenium voratum]CAJ1447662.1 unnamed protein product [Effrenium voratum]
MAFAKTPEGLLTKDEYDTCLGKLKFHDGLPDGDTIQKVYDNLDRSRATSVFLDMIPLASVEALRTGFVEVGCDACHKVVLFEKLMDSHSLFLTGNTDTVYVASILTLGTDGPTVIEVPGGAGPGTVNDAFFRFVNDMGGPGPDKGAGGKYLIVAPGYEGKLPEGYHVFHSPTYTNFVVNRGFLKDGRPDSAAANWKAGLKIYPLARAGNPPKMEFINVSGKVMNTIHSNDFHFFKEVDDVIQREPIEFLDPELRGRLKAIGIEKGKPFAPDERMTRLLKEGVAIGNATARAMCFAPRGACRMYSEDSEWLTFYAGWDYQWLEQGARNLDARTRYFYLATLNTPAMVLKMVGVGSQYALLARDGKHQYLDGGKCYSLTLPPNVPAKDFWSVVIYDAQHRSMLQTEQVSPGRNSVRHPDIKPNSDGSVTIWFAPSAPEGKEGNWIQTIPEKTWFMLLRVYGPTEAWFDKSWRPGEVQEEPEMSRKRKGAP